MGDFSKIDLYGEELTVKDAVARADISSMNTLVLEQGNKIAGNTSSIEALEDDLLDVNGRITSLEESNISVTYVANSETIQFTK